MATTLEKFLLKIGRDLTGGVIRLTILAEIGRHGPIHGYALIKALADNVGGPDIIRTGTLYPLLNELERDGLVRSTWAPGEAGPQRKEYELTAMGRQALRLSIREWARIRDAIDVVTRHQAGPVRQEPAASLRAKPGEST